MAVSATSQLNNGMRMDRWLKPALLVGVVAVLIGGALVSPNRSTAPPATMITAVKSPIVPFTALVIGGSGATGLSLIAQLVASSYCTKIITIGRRAADVTVDTVAPYVIDRASIDLTKIVHHDMDLSEMVTKAASLFVGVDVVYCTLGSRVKMGEEMFRAVDLTYPIDAAKLAHAAGVPSYQLVTSIGADASSNMLYVRVKGEVEQQLKQVGISRTTIWRPSVLAAEREVFRLSNFLFEKVMTYGANFVLQGGLRKYRSISVEDVASAMIGNTIWPRDAANGSQVFELYESDIIQDMANHYKSVYAPRAALTGGARK